MSANELNIKSFLSALKMREIEKGSFVKELRKIEMPSFYISEFPVTGKLWNIIMNDNKPLSISRVEWGDYYMFTQKLKELTGLTFSLPTENQWIYAANKFQELQINRKECKNYISVGLYNFSSGVWCDKGKDISFELCCSMGMRHDAVCLYLVTKVSETHRLPQPEKIKELTEKIEMSDILSENERDNLHTTDNIYYNLSLHTDIEPCNDDLPHHLKHFVEAQNRFDTYQKALKEVREGKKRGHWIWFIFPQMFGLGTSEMARHYGIRGREEAEEYINCTILRERLVEITEAVYNNENTVYEIFGNDAIKVRSCMLLFASVSDIPIFKKMIHKYSWK